MKVKEDIAPTVINKAKISIGLMSKDYGKKKLVFIPVMVALLCLGSWSQTAWAASCTVNNTSDSGPGTLRACINTANGSPGTTIQFKILVGDSGHQTDGSNHWWRIIPLTSLPTITANNTIIDGNTQALFDVININNLGPEIELFGSGAALNGLKITSANNTVKDLIIGGFSGDGLYINGGTGNTITGNYIGTDYKGTVAHLNTYGLVLDNSAASNTIGGTDPSGYTRNVISGNVYGIYITGVGTNSHLIQGNYIGINAAGTAPIANTMGVWIANGAKTTQIGGTDSNGYTRNVISGNTYGIYIEDAGTDSHLIQGNYIGINAAGTAQIANVMGVWIASGARTTQIGGTDPNGYTRNVISGNSYGIFISDAGTNSHLIQGNYIGLNAAGTAQIANNMGVWIASGARTTQIGGTDLNGYTRNVISGNTYGIYISDAGTDSHLIQGNYIGTDAAGTAAIPNSINGVYIFNGAKSTTVGGIAAGAANRIAYNGPGIAIKDVGTDGNIFSANSIFLNTGLGISLGGDGSNNNKAAPTIQSITANGANFDVTATFNPPLAAGDTIQFFRANNAASPIVNPDPTGAGEGYLYLGQCIDNGLCSGPLAGYMISITDGETVMPNTIKATLSGSGLTPGDTLSATTTDAINGTSAFAINKTVPLKLIKQTYDTSGVCIASSDAADAGCGSTSAVTVPAGMVVKFMIIVKNTSAQTATDVRFQDVLDESPTGFSYIPGSMFSTPVGASAPADNATNTVIYSAATNTLTDGAGDDLGSARDLGGPAGAENISIGNVNPGGINTALSIAAHKSFAVIFQVRKK